MAGGSANDTKFEAMSCSMCQNMYLTTDDETSQIRTPCMVFGCWHTFCRPCLVQWARSKQHPRGQFTCPKCRTVCTVAVEALPTNFDFRNLVEVERALTGQTKLVCSECTDDDASHYCQGCNMLLCQDCLKSHQKSKLRVCKHPAKTLQTIEEFKQSKQPVPKQKSNCTKHQGQGLDWYCLTCPKSICRDCTVNDHKGHECDLLIDVVGKHQVYRSLSPSPSIAHALSHAHMYIHSLAHCKKVLLKSNQLTT